jgi:hypothetical protein
MDTIKAKVEDLYHAVLPFKDNFSPEHWQKFFSGVQNLDRLQNTHEIQDVLSEGKKLWNEVKNVKIGGEAAHSQFLLPNTHQAWNPNPKHGLRDTSIKYFVKGSKFRST